ncbi:DUF6504 family protein [Nesterenkonia populi]|uniref:DUF6504 family protein n=1 Tax=Nesterenkonia populi TaxID=1591087 RepID=UPI0011BEE91B|nr:DUF6504 family protein [Nesterenkonia populi]
MTAVPDSQAQQPMAAVRTSASGAPAEFEYAGRRFRVCARPIPWIDRWAWWETARRAPAGKSAHLLDRPMWQVQAAAEDGEILIFDLAASPDLLWPVTAIYD